MVVAVALCGATDGASADEKSGSTVVVTDAEAVPGGTDIKGKVKSGKSKCKKNRKVSVYHDVAPPGPGPEDFLLGSTRTNDRGRWAVNTVFAPDKVYAVVKKNKSCKGDTSKTEVVD